MAIAMVPTIWNPNHSKTDLQNVRFLNGWFSDPHCIKVHGFKMPDVKKTHPMSRYELWAMSLELQGPNFVSCRVEPDAVCDVNSSHQGTLATHNLIQNKASITPLLCLPQRVTQWKSCTIVKGPFSLLKSSLQDAAANAGMLSVYPTTILYIGWSYNNCVSFIGILAMINLYYNRKTKKGLL